MAKTYLTVSFNEKDAAKSLGAKWDAVQRQWYVPDGRELASFSAWLPAGVATATLNTGLALFSAGSKDLTARKNGVSLSQLLAGVSQAVAQAYKDGCVCRRPFDPGCRL
jgi:exodeoxyribonuclease VII large subunit